MLETGVLKICHSNKQIGSLKNEKTLLADTNGMRKQMIRALVVVDAKQVIERERLTSSFFYSFLVISKPVTDGFAQFQLLR